MDSSLSLEYLQLMSFLFLGYINSCDFILPFFVYVCIVYLHSLENERHESRAFISPMFRVYIVIDILMNIC